MPDNQNPNWQDKLLGGMILGGFVVIAIIAGLFWLASELLLVRGAHRGGSLYWLIGAWCSLRCDFMPRMTEVFLPHHVLRRLLRTPRY